MAARGNRGGREATNADLGERGRRTGIAMPREGQVAMTQEGYEDMDAYFKSPEVVSVRKASSSSAIIMSQQIASSPPERYLSQSQQPPSSVNRRQRHGARPDVAHDIGIMGRKTGMPIVRTNRMPLAADGTEQMDPFFAQGPASIPPVQKMRRDEQESYGSRNNREMDNEDQTANYGRYAVQGSSRPRQSDATSFDGDEQQQGSDDDEGAGDDMTQVAHDSFADDSRISYAQTSMNQSGVTQSEPRSGDSGPASTPRGSRNGRGPRRSYGTSFRGSPRSSQGTSRRDGGGVEEDDGTQTMELEGSSYFNKSARSLAPIASGSQQNGRKSRTIEGQRNASSTPGSAASARERRRDVLGPRPSSRSRNGSGQDGHQTGEQSSSDEESYIQRSLTRSSAGTRQSTLDRTRTTEARRLSDLQTSSPLAGNRTGRLLFHGDSDAEDRQNGQDGSSDDDDGDDNADGFQPQMDENTFQGDFDGGDGAGHGNYEDTYGDIEGDGGEVPDSAEESEGDEADETTAGAMETIYEEEEMDEGGSEGEDEEVQDETHDSQLQEISKKKEKRKSLSTNDSGRGGEISLSPKRKKAKGLQYDENGLRRSNRDRTLPLEYWRNERVIYRRRDSGTACYYEKIGVESKPKPKARSLSKAPSSRSASVPRQGSRKPKGKGRLRSLSASSEDEDQKLPERPDMSVWDAETEPDGIVWDYVEGRERTRRIAFTKAMFDPKPTRKAAYLFQRVFLDGEYLAAGLLVLPPYEKKPLKPARDNTYIIFCYEGAVRVLVHRTEFSIAEGGIFLVPRGNSYQITNLTDIEAKLIFMQAREMAAVLDGGGEGQAVDEGQAQE